LGQGIALFDIVASRCFTGSDASPIRVGALRFGQRKYCVGGEFYCFLPARASAQRHFWGSPRSRVHPDLRCAGFRGPTGGIQDRREESM